MSSETWLYLLLLLLLFFSSPTWVDVVAVVINGGGGGVRGQEIICMGGPETVLNPRYTPATSVSRPPPSYALTYSTALRLFPVQQNRHVVVVKYNLVHEYI